MATITFLGKAQVNSGFSAISFDVIPYAEPQSIKVTQQYTNTVIMDRSGQDCSKRAQNEKYEGDVSFKLLGDTKANAQKINSVNNGGFLNKNALVTVSGADEAVLNAVWTLEPGNDLAFKNDDVADFSLKFMRYADSTQNTLMTSTPS